MSKTGGTVSISHKGTRRLQEGSLWVYAGDVKSVSQAVSGDLVTIVDHQGRSLGYGLYSDAPMIRVRWVGSPDAEIDASFWERRLTDAADYRRTVVNDTDSYRLVFGESDILPSLIIDRYRDHFVIQTMTPGMDALKDLWVRLLVDMFDPAAVIERNDQKVRQLERLPLQKGVIHGRADERLVVRMNGLEFRVDLLNGQKTGAFLDQRENYRAARAVARGRALDCFCYTGGFALHMAGSCDSVMALDTSGPALEEGRRNAVLNGIENIEWVEANVFDTLNQAVRQNLRFDTIVLDPPAFAKSRSALEGALRGYNEINLRAMQLLNPGGVLITCTCSYHLREEMFLNVLSSAASDAHRRIRIVEKRMQARDHPVLLAMPETHYLKCLFLQVF